MSLLRRSVVGAVVLLALPTAGHAISFDLTGDHCTGGCGTPPFGTVTVTQNGANVDITVDLANGPPNTVSWAKTGAADFQEFKFNGTGVALGDITVNQTFAGQTLAAQTGAFNGDGTGPFTFGIACTSCGNGALGITSDIVFHVANATIADLTGTNNLGNVFVADVFSSQTGNTGPVFVGPSPTQFSVPGPIAGAGLPGLIMAFGGVLALVRRRRRNAFTA